jgi:hypothetical protein
MENGTVREEGEPHPSDRRRGGAGSRRAQDLTDEYGTAVLRELFESRWRLW